MTESTTSLRGCKHTCIRPGNSGKKTSETYMYNVGTPKTETRKGRAKSYVVHCCPLVSFREKTQKNICLMR